MIRPAPQEAVDENEQVFYHHNSENSPTSPKHPQEVLSAQISKLSVGDKSKAR